MGLNFVAIDFETAAPKRDTACSVFMVRVRAGEIVDTFSSLINPECDFAPMNIAIHGITPMEVVGAPTFPDIADSILSFIGDDVVVAHNASFDLDVLEKMFIRYHLPVPYLKDFCTVQAARLAFPELPNHKLPTVCKALGIPLEHHHDASCDTIACARILIAISDMLQVSSFDELSDKLSLNLDYVLEKRKEEAREKARLEAEAKAAVKAASEAARAAKAAEKEARRAEREAKRAERKAKKAAASKKPRRSITQIDKDGNAVAVFDTVAAAAEAIGIDRKCIRDAANGIQKHAGGFAWSWDIPGDYNPSGEDELSMVNAALTRQADEILTALKKVKPQIAFSITYIPMADGKSVSFKVANGVLFKLCYTKQAIYIRIEDMKGLDTVSENISEFNDGFRKVIIDESFDLDGFAVLLAPVCDELFDASATVKIACCNDIYQCSEAKKCHKIEDPYYRGCYYRKNLESGHVFYGENKTI